MSLVSSNKLENGKIELVVEIKGDVFKKAVESSIVKNQKRIALPGFRKGKAPRNMIIKQVGMGMFYEEVVNSMYPVAYREAIDEAKIEPVDMADIEINEVDENGFTFKATVEVKPEAKVGNYKGLPAEKNVKPVTEQDVDAEIKKVQDRNSRMITVEDRPAKDGDITDINFEGFLDGVAFESGQAEHHSLTLGSGTFIPGFEAQVEGHSVGEEFDVNVTFPENYNAKELAGKPVVFKVKINEINERQLPVIDDEFAKDVSEFDTIAEYKADIKTNLEKSSENNAIAEMENNLVSTVVESTEVVIPNAMVESRINELVRDFEYRLSMQGMNMEMFMKYTGETAESFRKTFKEQAEKQVKTRLTLEAIAKVENITVAEDEIEKEYENLAEQYKMDVEKVKTLIPSKDITTDVSCNKALDLIKNSAVIKA